MRCLMKMMMRYEKQATTSVRRVFLVAMIALAAQWSVDSAQAKYIPRCFFDMVGTSDLIVAGTIVELSDDTFTLRVDRHLSGNSMAERVEVYQFQDWACAWRWGPYEVGQRMVAFLELAEESNAGRRVYHVVGAGCEGEFPIDGDCAYCTRIHARNINEYVEYGNQNFFPTDAEDLFSAIEGFFDLYEVTSGDLQRHRKRNDFTVFWRTHSLRRRYTEQQTDGGFRPRRPQPDWEARRGEYSRTSYIHSFLLRSTEEAIEVLDEESNAGP